MRKTRRILFVALLLLLAVVVAAALGVDMLAKLGVEKGGSYALGVQTTVERISLSPARGKLQMVGLRISNPEGFSSPYLMKSGRFDMEFRPGSLLTQTVEMSRFELDGLDVNIEQRVLDNNVTRIVENLKRFETDRQDQKRQGKKVHVDRIVIRNVTANFHLLSDLVAAEPITVKLDEIELADVASDRAGGVVIAELFRRLVPAIIDAILTGSEGKVPGGFLAGLNAQVEGVTGLLTAQATKLQTILGGGGD